MVKKPRIDTDDWRAFCTAITHKRTDTEPIFERKCHTLGQFLRTDKDVLQASRRNEVLLMELTQQSARLSRTAAPHQTNSPTLKPVIRPAYTSQRPFTD